MKQVLLAAALGVLAHGSSHATEPEPVQLAVIHFQGVKADEVVTAVKDRGYTFGIAKLPLFNAVLIRGTREEVARARILLSH